MIYFSRDERRRELLRGLESQPGPAPGESIDPPNGIDYLEVGGAKLTLPPDPARPGSSGRVDDQRQRVLRVYFVRPPTSALTSALMTRHVRITGGERITGLRVLRAEFKTEAGATFLEVLVDRRGDFSTYTLELHLDAATSEGAAPENLLPPLLDPPLSAIDFSFKVECPSEFDCASATRCEQPQPAPPELDFLAKDYASFRQLLLDRISALVPDWRERNPADLGVTLVELLAYVGDQLSYRQDAVATEAYLGTARQRVSVRRHARLLDYAMHDGCNARTWIHVDLKRDTPLDRAVYLPRVWNGHTGRPEELVPTAQSEASLARLQFSTRLPAASRVPDLQWAELMRSQQPDVFEAVEDAELFVAHNRMRFHCWGDQECCLPKGATKATLKGALPHLRPGHVLIFVEEIGPRTGSAADADPDRRWAVRLTRVQERDLDGFATPLDREPPLDHVATGPAGKPEACTTIEWSVADALPFPFTLSTVTDEGRYLEDVSVALGNNLLADHGRTLPSTEALPPVPASDPMLPGAGGAGCGCSPASPRASTPPRIRPALSHSPLTHAARLTLTSQPGTGRTLLAVDCALPATHAFAWEPDEVRPAIRLGDESGTLWLPQSDLLSSDAFSSEFVVETNHDGSARLRFGDDANGMRPASGTVFHACYRIGNGLRGNVGADALCHFRGCAAIPGLADVESITNPLPARGGLDPEPIERVRQRAPAAFRQQRRAVTPDDYARRAEQHPDVQRALGVLRWTGSWHTVFLTIDRRGGRPVDARFESELRAFLEPYRMAGHDLEIVAPVYVSLELELEVHIARGYYASDVTAELLQAFGRGLRPDGRRAFFHPDNFTFGTPLPLSRIYQEAQAVQGVARVVIRRLCRLDATSALLPARDVFTVSSAEILRLDHDPNFPERGRLVVVPVGP